MDLTYRTARNHPNPMEPHSTIARWNGNKLTVWDKTRWVLGTYPDRTLHRRRPWPALAVSSLPLQGGGGHRRLVISALQGRVGAGGV